MRGHRETLQTIPASFCYVPEPETIANHRQQPQTIANNKKAGAGHPTSGLIDS
jgi:hypothetical protein